MTVSEYLPTIIQRGMGAAVSSWRLARAVARRGQLSVVLGTAIERVVAFIVPANLAGAVLGWTSAIAAYGAFVIPKILGQQIAAHTPERAFFGFAAYYGICLTLVWWFYLRHGGVERVDRQPSPA